MIMSQDPVLHAAQLAANTRQGAQPYDIADVVATSSWRDSHDAGGPHAPFDKSAETNGGAPRGQTQYFANPASAAATAPLGRMDLMTLVDPYALEMDEDYDCTHNSNPACSYIFYGPACAPESNEPGTQITVGLAMLVLSIGYIDLARGGMTVAPVMLVVGYGGLVPLAIGR